MSEDGIHGTRPGLDDLQYAVQAQTPLPPPLSEIMFGADEIVERESKRQSFASSALVAGRNSFVFVKFSRDPEFEPQKPSDIVDREHYNPCLRGRISHGRSEGTAQQMRFNKGWRIVVEIVTKEMIESARRGGLIRAILASLGVPWPPPSGWKDRILDKPIKPLSIKGALSAKMRQRWLKNTSTLPPTTIPYPSKPSEFEIQARLYIGLCRHGFDARGEVNVIDGSSRLDLVVFAHGEATRVIEIKPKSADTRKQARKSTKTRQIGKYKQLCVPVDVVLGAQEGKRYLGIVKESGMLPYDLPYDWKPKSKG